MPEVCLLPLGTVCRPKKPIKGMEDIRFMITGWFPWVDDENRGYDYTVTPWPLGYLNMKNGEKRRFLSCDEEALGDIEFLGGVDEALALEIDNYIRRVNSRAEFNSPLASGKESRVAATGDLPCTMGSSPYAGDWDLPLGSIVTTAWGDKAMVYGLSTKTLDDGKTYDYVLCPWPGGVDRGSGTRSLFLSGDIATVHFRGYENALSQELAKRLAKKRRGSLFSRIIGKGKSW